MTQAAILASNGSLMTAPSGTAPAYQCRAWVNFNGTGTVAIRASGNVSSITDRGTGLYTVNLATALPDANMAVTFGGQVGGAGRGFYSDIAPTTSAVYVYCTTASATVDPSDVYVAVFR